MPPAPPDPGKEMGRRQEALARALTAGGLPPSGFDADRIQLAARSLLAKRTSAAARSWPGLVDAIGGEFVERFHTYAKANLLEEGASPLEDLLRFARDLAGRRSLPVRAVRLICVEEARRRRVAWMRDAISGRWVIAVRVPVLGARCFSIRGFGSGSR